MKLKKFSCREKKNWKNIAYYSISSKNINQLINELYQSNTTLKIIEWYIGWDWKMKIKIRNCLIYGENILYSTN